MCADCLIGPQCINGQYPVLIRSIHNSIREDVNIIHNGVQGCFAIKFVNPKHTLTKSQIKKGFVLLDSIEKWKDNITDTFTAKIKILHHSSTIRTGYCPLIHCGPIRQSAHITLINEEYLKSNDNALVLFKFNHHKEFVEKNMILFFRDGNTKGIGEII